jgi:hypothetical protein
LKTLDYIPTGKLERAGKLVSTGVKIGGNYIKYIGDKITNPEQAKELGAYVPVFAEHGLEALKQR